MPTFNLNGSGSYTSTGSVAVAGTGSYVSLGIFQLGGGKRGGILALTIGTNAITGLQLTRSATPSNVLGTTPIHVVAFSGSGFDTPAGILLDTVPSSAIATLSASGVGQIKLDKLEGIQEIELWAKASTATTVSVDASFT